MKWKLFGNVTGRESIYLPNDYSEILLVVEMPYTGFPLGVSFVLSKNDLTYDTRYFDSGSPNAYARIGISTVMITMNHAFCYNTEYSSLVTLKAYYR